MDLFDMELKKAERLIEATGRARNDFTFRQRHLPPDPDDAVMFTARYEVTITHSPSGRSLETIGGIGLDWTADFGRALSDGDFD